MDVEVINCNVATPPAASLLRVEGEYEHERFGELLAAGPSAEEYELLALIDRACYCFVTGVGT